NFSPNDLEYKDISSLILLSEVKKMLNKKEYKIINIDSVIVAQKPKLSHFIPQMEGNIAQTLGVDADCISIKAKTEEGLGFTGTEQGIAAMATVLILKEKGGR
ncbi:MAG: 2-C-methyl-D-erythritol 2,4-cyclodiphosphate synthase, partial [Defluviitaleaceae bacterium]|nr:2-C-methyl-D-erythritol 2,4-cyclodiphosphate synthase [Defluviitaleaceae bacterium]